MRELSVFFVLVLLCACGIKEVKPCRPHGRVPCAECNINYMGEQLAAPSATPVAEQNATSSKNSEAQIRELQERVESLEQRLRAEAPSAADSVVEIDPRINQLQEKVRLLEGLVQAKEGSDHPSKPRPAVIERRRDDSVDDILLSPALAPSFNSPAPMIQ